MIRAGVTAFGALLAVTVVLAGCATATRNQDVAAEYYNVGNAYAGLGQFDKAALYYRDAVRLDPSNVQARYNLALALIRTQNTSEAREVLARLLSDDPQNVTVMAALGWALHIEGKDADSLAMYDKIIQLSPENQDALYNGALVLWKLDRKPEALERLQKLLTLAPDDADALYGAASLLLQLDEPQKALENLDRLLEKKPDQADAQLLRADCFERLEKYSQALDAYDKVVTLDAKEPRAWFGKARLLLTVIEDPDKGLSALKQALELGFHDMDAVKVLLDSSQLQKRSDVEAALKARNMLPQTEPAAKDEKGGGEPPAKDEKGGTPPQSPTK
jgi:tetratricopeptide (TPR) repeat protein